MSNCYTYTTNDVYILLGVVPVSTQSDCTGQYTERLYRSVHTKFGHTPNGLEFLAT